ncbi:hypothetical protein WICPIJ_002480, partial [Wickerhamomyces pijperi]
SAAAAGKSLIKGLTPPPSVKTNNGLITPASSDGYYTPQEKNGSVSTPVKKQNYPSTPPSSSKVKTIPALKSPTAPPPDSITCQLSESETPVKLDFIHGASLVYSSLKSITKSKDSLDDLTINTIITNHSKELQEETRGMVLMITDVGLLYLFDLPDSEDPEYDLLLKVKLTDRSFAMYDYEFDEQLHSGYLILEDVALDLLMFISSIPRFQTLKLLDGQAEFKIGNDMTWIEALMKTKKLLKSKKSTVTAAAAGKVATETTKRQTSTVNASKQKATPTSSPINIKQQPLKKSSTPPLSTPPSMNKSPVIAKKPTSTLPISPILNYTANAKPILDDSSYSSSIKTLASKYKLGSNALISALRHSPSNINSANIFPVPGALLIPQQECPDAKYRFSTFVSPINGPEEDGTSNTGR